MLARRNLVIGAVLLVAVSAFAMRQRGQPPAVEVAEVKTSKVLEVVFATGVVKPDREVSVAATASGRIVSLWVDEGDTIAAGQVIAQIDSSEQEARLREAENRLRTAQARLTQLIAPSDPYDVAQARAQWEATQAKRAAAQRKQQSVTTQQRMAESDAQSAAINVSIAQARLKAAEEAVRTADTSVDSAEARLKAAKENVRVWTQGQLRVAEAAVQSAAEDVTAAQARLTTAEDFYKRRKELFAQNAVAEQEVVEAENKTKEVQANLAATRARLASAQANVEVAKQTIAMAQAQVDDSASQVETARSNLAQAKVKTEDARHQVEVAKSQLRKAQAQVENVGAQAGEAASSVTASASESNAARANFQRVQRGAREVDIAVARTEVQTAQASLAQARVAWDKCTVRAAFAGVMTRRLLQVGDFAAIGAPIFNMANAQRIYVEAQVDEADLGSVRRGGPARFTVDAYPDRVFSGRVSRIGDAGDRVSKTYPVEIRALDSTEGLRMDMSADVNIQGRTKDDALLIPAAALVTDAKTQSVWVVEGDGTLALRAVETRNRGDSQVEVVRGVKAGERVVVNPKGLKEGQKVNVKS
jgi:HlyD family secretion protein